MGFFSFIGGLIGGGKAKKASRNAEAAQLEYLNKALAEQQRQFDVTRADYGPLLKLLAPSVEGLADGIGLNGTENQQAFMDLVQTSPALASRIRNGEEAMLANASATGGLRGGNMQDALFNNRAVLFADELDRKLAQLAGAAGLGSGATDAVSSFGANKANQISNLFGQQGQVRAGGILTRGGINAQNWVNAGNGIEDALKAIFGGGG
jgi:hypothetical protein